MIDQKNSQKESGFFLKTEEFPDKRPSSDDDYDNQIVTCNKIFSTFLIQISQFVNKEVYRELCIFVCLYRYYSSIPLGKY